jgi:Na+/proline symporter
VALHRITRVYGILGVIVPVVGITLAVVQGRMGEVWISVAMVLTALAGALLAFLIHPGQRDALAEPDDGTRLRSLGMLAGVYNLLWAVVVVLMIVRPGAYR